MLVFTQKFTTYGMHIHMSIIHMLHVYIVIVS